MGWHMLAFEKASAGGVVLEDVPGIQDDIVALNAANHYLLPKDMSLRFAYVLSPNAIQAQISTPHFRIVALPAIEPLDIGTNVTSLPAIDWNTPPYSIVKQNDELTMLQSDNAGAGIQKVGIMGLADSDNLNYPQGEIFSLRATAANTSNVRTWQTQTVTFDQTIAVGTYSVIGMDAIGANLIAARAIFPGGGFRPGCLGRTTEATKPELNFRKGRMGEFGRFTNTAPPSIQLLGSGALVTQTIIFDVVKVG